MDEVVKVEFYREEAAGLSKAPDSYDGLPIYAAKGLHQHVMEMVKELVPVPAAVLELGAGTGAMSRRLSDHFYNVTAVDKVAENFRPGLPLVCADLNEHFSAALNRQFDAIVAMEIIEHLENPWHFFREARRLLRKNGKLIVTTPNTESAISICQKLIRGHHAWFSDEDYVRAGHITPLTSWHLRYMAHEAKFSVKSISSFGRGDGTWKMRLLSKGLRALSHFSLQQGEILTMVCVNREGS